MQSSFDNKNWKISKKKRKKIIANFLYKSYALYTRVMQKCTMVCKCCHCTMKMFMDLWMLDGNIYGM
jgi:hypothetical protein